jgi:hypothetical protein
MRIGLSLIWLNWTEPRLKARLGRAAHHNLGAEPARLPVIGC